MRASALLGAFGLLLVSCGDQAATYQDSGQVTEPDSTFDTKSDQQRDFSVQPDASIQPDLEPHEAKLFVSEYGLFLNIKLEGKGPFIFRYDTGAPFSFIYKKAAIDEGLGAGAMAAELDGLVLAGRQFEIFDRPHEGPYADISEDPIVGTVGNDFFAGYAVGINFRDEQLWLVESQTPTTLLPVPAGTTEPTIVSMTQPLGYLLVSCAFGDMPPTRDCLLDLGSIDSIAMQDYWQTLTHPNDWKVPTWSADVFGTLLEGYYQRTSATVVDSFRQEADYVAVFANFSLLDEVGDAIGHDIDGLIGVATLLGHYSVIDYSNNRLLLYPYTDLSHLPESPFVGFGFVLTSSTGWDLSVAGVVEKSQAAAAGIKQGDELVEIDGIDWKVAPGLRFSPVGIIAQAAGTKQTMTFDRDGARYTVSLVAEDLLP